MNLEILLQTIGYLGFFLIIFLESGVLLGLIFPGDSLLLTASFLAAGGYFDIRILILSGIVAAILGDNVGYFTGKYFGPRIFKREESFFFKKSYINSTQDFFNKYGRSSIILARFTPVIRTITPIMAGIGNMDYRVFLTFNIIGAFIWAGGLLTLGYYSLTLFPSLKEYLEYIILIIVFISFIPIIQHFYTIIIKKLVNRFQKNIKN